MLAGTLCDPANGQVCRWDRPDSWCAAAPALFLCCCPVLLQKASHGARLEADWTLRLTPALHLSLLAAEPSCYCALNRGGHLGLPATSAAPALIILRASLTCQSSRSQVATGLGLSRLRSGLPCSIQWRARASAVCSNSPRCCRAQTKASAPLAGQRLESPGLSLHPLSGRPATPTVFKCGQPPLACCNTIAQVFAAWQQTALRFRKRTGSRLRCARADRADGTWLGPALAA